MRILHLEYDQYPDEAIRLLERHHEVEGFVCTSQENLYQKLAADHYDVIFTRLGLMLDQRSLNLQPQLRYIVTSTTGLNHIDAAAVKSKNISIISLKGEAEFLANVKSTAEHTWGLLLALIRNLPSAIDHVNAGGWDRSPFLSDELDGKTLGIIGYGRLGKIVANYGIAFGMSVLTHDHHTYNYQGHTHIKSCDLEELLQRSDVIVLLISWSPENENFLDRHKFNQIKSGAYFINTSRGELIDEQALLDALVSRKIKGAALDVLWNDSSWSDSFKGSTALHEYARTNHNLLITPHMGGYGKDSIAKTRTFVTQKFLSLLG